MTVLLEARQISYHAGGLLIIDRLDLRVRAGERLAVTGPSGSGKSSLLSVLAGLVRPTAGTVWNQGRPLSGPPSVASGIATVLQGYGLVSLLTATENIEIALRAAGYRKRAARHEAAGALQMVGLADHAHHLANDLSGGQQQRVAIARALAMKPRILLADEPTAELDPATRALALDRIMAATAGGGAVIVATHDPGVAAACDRVVDLGADRTGRATGPGRPNGAGALSLRSGLPVQDPPAG